MRLSFPHTREHIISWSIDDAISEIEEKMFRESITLSSDEYFAYCVQAVQWKLLNAGKVSTRYLPLDEAGGIADYHSIERDVIASEQLDEVLKVLTDKERCTVMLQSWFGYSYERIAGIYGVTIHAVKSVLANARKKIEPLRNTPPAIIIPI
jgi:DNA-directed RNA polymerase specialized sigma24 family protein